MFRSKYPQHLKLDNEMNEIIGDFIDYLLNTKNYSTHTATAYESDLRDFTEFYERIYRILIQYVFVHGWQIAQNVT